MGFSYRTIDNIQAYLFEMRIGYYQSASILLHVNDVVHYIFRNHFTWPNTWSVKFKNCTVLPAVPDRACWAPVRVRTPPSFRCLAASWAANTDDQTLCWHIISQFFTKSDQKNAKIIATRPERSQEFFIWYAKDCLHSFCCWLSRLCWHTTRIYM